VPTITRDVVQPTDCGVADSSRLALAQSRLSQAAFKWTSSGYRQASDRIVRKAAPSAVFSFQGQLRPAHCELACTSGARVSLVRVDPREAFPQPPAPASSSLTRRDTSTTMMRWAGSAERPLPADTPIGGRTTFVRPPWVPRRPSEREEPGGDMQPWSSFQISTPKRIR
jgi:hypothetical protein